jgi:hypothetical protein
MAVRTRGAHRNKKVKNHNRRWDLLWTLGGTAGSRNGQRGVCHSMLLG